MMHILPDMAIFVIFATNIKLLLRYRFNPPEGVDVGLPHPGWVLPTPGWVL